MNNSIFLEKATKWGLIIATILSTIYLCGLGFFNTFLLDDYIFIAKLNDSNLFEFIRDMYMTWQGRYSGFFLSGGNYLLFKGAGNLLLMTVLHLVFGYTVVYILFHNIFRTNISVFQKVIYSILTVNLIILALPCFNSFYWGCTVWYISINYLYIILLLIVFNKNTSIVSYVGMVISAILLGGMSEVYTPVILGGILLIWLYSKFVDKRKDNVIDSKIWIVSAIILLSFVILLIAPGNKVRISETTGTFPPVNLNFFVKTITLYVDFLFFVFAKSFYYIVIFFIFTLLGIGLKSRNVTFSTIEKMNKKSFLISLILLFIALYVCIVPGVFAMGGVELAPLRSYSYVSFVLGGYAAFWGVKVGMKKYNFVIGRVISLLIIFVLVGLITFNIVIDFPQANKYQNSISLLHKELIALKENGNKYPVRVKPIEIRQHLSAFSVLYNNTIAKIGLKAPKYYHDFFYMRYYLSPDVNDWRNQGLKQAFQLDFDIIGWEREFLWYIE